MFFNIKKVREKRKDYDTDEISLQNVTMTVSTELDSDIDYLVIDTLSKYDIQEEPTYENNGAGKNQEKGGM